MCTAFIAPCVLLSNNTHRARTWSHSTTRRVPSASAGVAPGRLSNKYDLLFTHLGNQTFTLDGAGVRLLVNPALEGGGIHFGPHGLFTIALEDDCTGLDDVGDFDAVVLTQFLPHHTHEPTLCTIVENRPDVPVFAPLEARAFLLRIGFTDVRVARPGDTIDVAGVSITAGRGVQFPYFSPNFALLFDFDGLSAYYEGYGHPSKKFLTKCSKSPPNAVITPGVDLKIDPFDFRLVTGAESALEIVRQLQPASLVVFDGIGRTSGMLAGNFVKTDTRDTLRQALQNDLQLENVTLIEPNDKKESVAIASKRWQKVKR